MKKQKKHLGNSRTKSFAMIAEFAKITRSESIKRHTSFLGGLVASPMYR